MDRKQGLNVESMVVGCANECVEGNANRSIIPRRKTVIDGKRGTEGKEGRKEGLNVESMLVGRIPS